METQVKEIRGDYYSLSRDPIGGRYPVIVFTGERYGIQFWTPEMIEQGKQINTDGSVSIFIDKL